MVALIKVQLYNPKWAALIVEVIKGNQNSVWVCVFSDGDDCQPGNLVDLPSNYRLWEELY